MWVNGMPDAEWQYKESDDAESTLIVHFPYPRFAKPFDFYQQHLNLFSGNFTDDRKLSDGSILLSEINVNARHSSLRQIPYSMPAFQVDGYEGYNHAIDGNAPCHSMAYTPFIYGRLWSSATVCKQWR